MKKRRKNNFFTLVELLVSLGVFSILLVIFMQLFSGLRLVVANSELRTTNSTDIRVTMDLFSTLLGTLYYSTANTDSAEKGYFPFEVVQGGANNNSIDQFYFATKANLDLAGTSPIRYVGFMVPNRFENLETENAVFYDKLFLTVLSNKEGTNNADVYRQLFPQFSDSDDKLVKLATVKSTLTDNLKGKLRDNSTPETDTHNRIKLLDNVVEFKVRLLKADGTPESGNTITANTRQIEIRVSVLADKDYKEWVTLCEEATSEPSDAKKFRAVTQTTFCRRIYVDDHSLLEDTYE